MAVTPGSPGGRRSSEGWPGPADSSATPPASAAELSYEQFAFNLLSHAITADRVAAVITSIAGDRVEVGPLVFGPGGAASVIGVADIGPVRVRSTGGREIGFEATVPGALTLEVTVRRHQYRYDGDVSVPLRISVQLTSPVVVVLSIATVRPPEVAVRLRTSGMAAFVLQTLGDADHEIAIQVAQIVNERARSVDHLCRIDVGTLLDEAWDSDLRARLLQHRQPR